MTRKSTLIQWGHHLGVVLDAQQGQDMTAAELERCISEALVQRDYVSAGEPPVDEPQYSLRDGLVNNFQVIRQELPSAARAVARNLFG
ncbi:MAG: hypothetical protein HC857_13965 [Synechococcales cyanobacterium RU_4_20]|nr:hypothetical protein [Synechococcales cyanobacterium RU_4_20]NJR70882.1 hypothetical protein [Synechococcales cyanobacterium CRU_2_2]